MSDSFDPYYKWLGIPPKDQPPHHYRLLGIEPFESDLQVIESAADRQMSHLRTYQAGKNSAVSQRILNELSSAKITLLHPDKKAAYDAALQKRLAGTAAVAAAKVSTPAADQPAAAPAWTMPIPPAAFKASAGHVSAPAERAPAAEAFSFDESSSQRRRRTQQNQGVPPQVWLLAVLCVAVAVAGVLAWQKYQREQALLQSPPPPASGAADGK